MMYRNVIIGEGGCGVDMPHHRRNLSELGVVVHEEFVGVGAQCDGNHVL